jgi:hypothetical protein
MGTTVTIAANDGPDVSETRLAGAPTYEINIEGRLYTWNESIITPAQVRQLGGLPNDQAVIEIDFHDNTERTLSEGEIVEVKPGKGFGKKVGFWRGDQ